MIDGSRYGELDGATCFFYDGQRVIEERDGSEALVQQFVHGTQYIDELLMIRGTYGAYWVYQDANWNVIALTSPAAALVEEYDYTPYSRLLVRRRTAFGDADADGDLDSADNIAWNSTQGELGVYDRAFDADLDGDNDSFDETAFDRNYDAAGTSVIVPARGWSPTRNDFTYTGQRLDPESSLMHYRRRTYSPAIKEFLQRDPSASAYLPGSTYDSGYQLYAYARLNPLDHADPSGFVSISPGARTIGAIDGIAAAIRAARLPAFVAFRCMCSVMAELGVHDRDLFTAWSFQHCVAHCAIVRHCGGAGVSQAIGVLTEIIQIPQCWAGILRECESAWQASDWWDNELGRRCGANIGQSCIDCCKIRMNGWSTNDLPEGPGTSRPFGPFYPFPDPEHPAPNSPAGGLPMPDDWGPERGSDGAPCDW